MLEAKLCSLTNRVNNKMLVRTDSAVASGKGTAMHSKSGISTIPQYVIFKEQDDQKSLSR